MVDGRGLQTLCAGWKLNKGYRLEVIGHRGRRGGDALKPEAYSL
jgi:hypothetical protein